MVIFNILTAFLSGFLLFAVIPIMVMRHKSFRKHCIDSRKLKIRIELPEDPQGIYVTTACAKGAYDRISAAENVSERRLERLPLVHRVGGTEIGYDVTMDKNKEYPLLCTDWQRVKDDKTHLVVLGEVYQMDTRRYFIRPVP